jgi:16S rRNA (cytidine1402-2'-O)-methyltransferase
MHAPKPATAAPGGSGTLFVVATPIGNLGDLSPRARGVLGRVAAICAEDTRRTRQLLGHFGIERPLLALHEHNEQAQAALLVERLRGGDSLALVSDAGTPLVSDPGFRLVRAAAAAGVAVSPVPGPSALLAALSVAGLPTDRFVFEGFLPARAAARRARLEGLAGETRTLVFFEAGNRLAALLGDAGETLGAERAATVARELTKLHETLYRGTLAELAARLAADHDASRGESVVIVAGREPAAAPEGDEALLDRLLPALLEELPPSRAARIASKLTGVPRPRVYERALELSAR